MTLSKISTATEEGKLLIAALSILTTSETLSIMGVEVKGRSCEPDEMLSHVENLKNHIYNENKSNEVDTTGK